jgi:hypothetical protein
MLPDFCATDRPIISSKRFYQLNSGRLAQIVPPFGQLPVVISLTAPHAANPRPRLAVKVMAQDGQ